VQKGRFAEAILLYQRSIDLFGSDKDKAVSWNRLGNVYRRLNDYENSIAAYQRADELDPENSTLSLQSRFSLLGNYATEQVPSQVA
jgi:tetratricopeptide (TPR) repeat protein